MKRMVLLLPIVVAVGQIIKKYKYIYSKRFFFFFTKIMRYKIDMNRFSLVIRKSFPPTEKVRFQVSLPVIAGKGPISKTASDEFMKR